MKRTRWGAILFAYAVGVVGAVQVGRVAPAGEALAEELGLSLARLGWTVSLITLASAALGLAAGHLIVRQGAKRILVAGTAILCAGTALAATAGSISWLLVMRALEGVGYLGVVVAAPTLIAALATPRDAPIALALWGTFFTAGLSLAALAGGWASEAFGWRGWYALNAGLLAVTAGLALAALPKTAGVKRSADADRPRLPLSAWLLGLAFLGLTLLSLALLSMLPPFLIAARGFSPGEAGAATGLVALASLGGSLAYGAVARRMRRGPVVIGAVILLVVTAVPAFHIAVRDAAGLATASLAVGASGVLVAHVFAAVPRLVEDPAQIGPANGLIAQIGSLGALTGPPLVGALVAGLGWLAVPILVSAFAFGFALLANAAERRATQGTAV